MPRRQGTLSATRQVPAPSHLLHIYILIFVIKERILIYSRRIYIQIRSRVSRSILPRFPGCFVSHVPSRMHPARAWRGSTIKNRRFYTIYLWATRANRPYIDTNKCYKAYIYIEFLIYDYDAFFLLLYCLKAFLKAS